MPKKKKSIFLLYETTNFINKRTKNTADLFRFLGAVEILPLFQKNIKKCDFVLVKQVKDLYKKVNQGILVIPQLERKIGRKGGWFFQEQKINVHELDALLSLYLYLFAPLNKSKKKINFPNLQNSLKNLIGIKNKITFMGIKKIKETLLLPKTSFPLWNIDHLVTEKNIREQWIKKQIYQKILVQNQSNPVFILHSGSPYANGKLHIGHFLNFLIKDIVVRFQASEGNYVPFLLGWDAHGLPTEHKILQIYKDKKTDLRPLCHQFALEQAQIQRKQLKKLGLFTDYEKYYITSDKEYEAEQIRIFGEMVKKELIYQAFRPIHWSCSHETALAEAEIEYYEKKDTSLYFKIKLAENLFGKKS